MSAVRRWTWPMRVPAAMGSLMAARLDTPADAPTPAPGPRALAPPAPGPRAARRLAPGDGHAPAQRARGRRRGAGGSPALAGLAHVAWADRRAPGGSDRPARRVLRALPRAPDEVFLRPLAPGRRRPRRG